MMIITGFSLFSGADFEDTYRERFVDLPAAISG